MLVLFCRNRVKDYDKWKSVFDSHGQSHKDFGLTLLNMWRDTEDMNNVFFTFEVSDKQMALQFINSTESAEAGRLSGVVDGKVHFLVNC